MQASQTWDKISASQIREAAALYPEHVPEGLASLDEQRLVIIPRASRERRTKKVKDGGGAYLKQAELVKLVEWKLKHGKFRPNLLKFASSNASEFVEDTTREAFAAYSPDSLAAPSKLFKAGEPLGVLTKLKGVGPATASLLLAVHDPENVPFFADELYRYFYVTVDKSGKAKGWDSKIDYNKKDYEFLCEKVGEVRKRVGKDEVTALEVEKAAWVLAKRSQGSEDSSTKGKGTVPASSANAEPAAKGAANKAQADESKADETEQQSRKRRNRSISPPKKRTKGSK